MLSRFGLRTRMATSYVVVSAAAVLLVEAVVLALAVPRIVAAGTEAKQAKQAEQSAEAERDLTKLSESVRALKLMMEKEASRYNDQEPGHTDADMLTAVLASETTARNAKGEFVDAGEAQWKAVATADGWVVLGSPIERFPQNRLPAAAMGDSTGGTIQMNGDEGLWAVAPIELDIAGGGLRRIGLAYVAIDFAAKMKPSIQEKDRQARLPGVVDTKDAGAVKPTVDTRPVGEIPAGEKQPPGEQQPAGDKQAADPTTPTAALSRLVTPAAIALVLLLPVGGLFGLLSTGPLIRRIRRLADGTAAMAAGDLGTRIPPSGGDEVGRLEVAFNTMAARLAEAQEAQRVAAGAQARQAERARIARELHDAISQDLFSVSLVAGGLRKALPAATELQRQAAAMEISLARTMREMRAMLLELRPIALEDAGLPEAIGELCRAYEERVGVHITTAVADLPNHPAVEHAVLRVTQEALANAIRHGDPAQVDLRVEPEEQRWIAVTVRDDGRGFDPSTVGDRLGMGLRLMHERAAELGGTVDVRSAPGEGTTVRVRLPIGV